MGVINDFRDSFAFIDYKEYGELKVWDACKTSGDRSEKLQDYKIHVFLNLKKVGEFSKKSEAYLVVKKLIEEAPTSFFEENKALLLSDLC